MRLSRLNVFILAIITLSLVSFQMSVYAEGVEIQYGGLSPSAQQAVQNMAQQRAQVK